MEPQSVAGLSAKLERLRREGEERQAQRTSQIYGYPYVDLLRVPGEVDALKLIPEAEAREAKMASIEVRSRRLAIAVFNPDLPAAKKILEDLRAKRYDIKIFVTSLSGLEQAWKLYRFVKAEAEDITGKVSIEPKRLEEFMARLGSFTAIREEILKLDFLKATPVTIVEIILAGALAVGASDIHLEAGEKKSKIRFRVDGLLHDAFTEFPTDNYKTLVSRIKLLAGLKINIRDESQDGRFTINIGSKEIEVRVSVIPAEFGETIVMRVLDPAIISLNLSELGLREDDLVIVEQQIAKPNGLILNTGPTGSGKTTTLYAFLTKINNPETKIITLEDPIEYHVAGIEQTQVDNNAGYTFAKGLRAIVRQDPDVVLVGEIRDQETADISLQAALTGHLVLSTLHTNDAIGAVPRLINLGVKAVSIGPALNLIIAQRLVRRLCPDCKKSLILPKELEEKVKKFFAELPKRVDHSKYQKIEICQVVGCAKCNNLGFKGRIGIFEFLEGGLELEELILKEASEISMKRLAVKQGMVTMQQDGILKTLAGETTFEEVESVTGKIEWTS